MFLFKISDQVESLQEIGAAYHLDLSVESLDRLEKFFDTYRKQPPAGLDETELMIICARYLGQVLRENYGGKWDLPLDDPNNINFNSPVIVGARGSITEFPPIDIMRAYSLRPKPGFLRQALESEINPKLLDLSDLAED